MLPEPEPTGQTPPGTPGAAGTPDTCVEPVPGVGGGLPWDGGPRPGLEELLPENPSPSEREEIQ